MERRGEFVNVGTPLIKQSSCQASFNIRCRWRSVLSVNEKRSLFIATLLCFID